MATAAPDPQNMLMLGALGLGAYWFFSRRAAAAAPPSTPGTRPAAGASAWAANDSALWSTIGRLLGPTSPAQTKVYNGANADAALNNPQRTYGSEPGDPYHSGADFVYDSAAVNPSPDVDIDLAAVTPSRDIDWDSFNGGDLGQFF